MDVPTVVDLLLPGGKKKKKRRKQPQSHAECLRGAAVGACGDPAARTALGLHVAALLSGTRDCVLLDDCGSLCDEDGSVRSGTKDRYPPPLPVVDGLLVWLREVAEHRARDLVRLSLQRPSGRSGVRFAHYLAHRTALAKRLGQLLEVAHDDETRVESAESEPCWPPLVNVDTRGGKGPSVVDPGSAPVWSRLRADVAALVRLLLAGEAETFAGEERAEGKAEGALRGGGGEAVLLPCTVSPITLAGVLLDYVCSYTSEEWETPCSPTAGGGAGDENDDGWGEAARPVLVGEELRVFTVFATATCSSVDSTARPAAPHNSTALEHQWPLFGCSVPVRVWDALERRAARWKENRIARLCRAAEGPGPFFQNFSISETVYDGLSGIIM